MGSDWVVVHSGYHRELAQRIILNREIGQFGHVVRAKPEVRRGASRLDFLVTKGDGARVWVEVKGCTLALDGVALFPGAPTARGRKHLQTLISLREEGEAAALLVLVFRREAGCFAPNTRTDPGYASLFYEAMRLGVEVYPLVLAYQDGVMYYPRCISVCSSYSAHRA
jgi:sugar fermentation stimulation protein A